MPITLEAVRPISLSEIQEARQRIAATIVRTPLIRLQMRSDHPEILLKLETLQPINSFKLRGAANAVAGFHVLKTCGDPRLGKSVRLGCIS